MTAIKELLSKYIQNSERVFAEMKLSQDAKYIDEEKTKEVIDAAKRYLEDAKYYCEKEQFETGLVSVAYSEGLLDALRLLGIANFKWPTNRDGNM
jgi:FAD synthetase